MGRKFRAGFTIEAAIVVSFTLIFMLTFFETAMKLHDSCCGNAAAAEIIERSVHAEKNRVDEEIARLSEYGSRRLENMLSQKRMRLNVKREGKTITGIVEGREYRNTQRLRIYEPELMVRRLTLMDVLK